jgi:serine O-acetyltransferase
MFALVVSGIRMNRITGTETSHSLKQVRARHPHFFEAVLLDLRVAAAYRGGRYRFRSSADAILQALRLMCVHDAFFALVLYRLKARLQALGVPVLPRLAHRLAIATAQVSIGDPVVIHPGVALVHGQVVIDGFVEVLSGTSIAPFVTIGRRSSEFTGPTIGPNAMIGSGAKILGPIRIGSGASVGANAVVLTDIPPQATAVGIPARVVDQQKPTDDG